MRTVGVGVVGCGRNADNHLRVYANSDKARIAALCDRNIGKANQKAREYGVSAAYSDFNSLLKLDLDLIDIITPTPSHAPLAVQVLESGHNVLVEKPMALTSDQATRMKRAADKAGRSLCVAHTKRFFNCVRKTSEALQEEGLETSRIRFTHYYVSHGGNPDWIFTEETGGMLWEALVHHAYIVLYFLGEIDSVMAYAKKIKYPVHDSLTLLLTNDRGTGVCEYEYDVQEPLESFHLTTKRGDVFEGNMIHDVLSRSKRDFGEHPPGFLRRIYDDSKAGISKRLGYLKGHLETRPLGVYSPFRKTFYALIGELLSHLTDQKTSLPVPPEEGIRTIRILEEARDSISTGTMRRI